MWSKNVLTEGIGDNKSRIYLTTTFILRAWGRYLEPIKSNKRSSESDINVALGLVSEATWLIYHFRDWETTLAVRREVTLGFRYRRRSRWPVSCKQECQMRDGLYRRCGRRRYCSRLFEGFKSGVSHVNKRGISQGLLRDECSFLTPFTLFSLFPILTFWYEPSDVSFGYSGRR
jgi:hypothetical protein